MSYKESAHKNLLMGVSQQAPQDRLPGQLSEQINMISDPVTGLRRRPGTEFISFVAQMDLTGQPRPKIYHTDINNRSVVFLIWVHTGDMLVFDDVSGAFLQGYSAIPYLLAGAASNLHMVTIGDDVFIANTTVKPVKGAAPAGTNPKRQGFFYVPAGQYSKNFTITLTNAQTGIAYTASYVTPSGSSPDDAAKSSVHAVAWQLFGQIYGRTAQVLPGTATPDPSRPAVAADPALQPIRDHTISKGLDQGYAAIVMDNTWDLVITSNTGSGFLRTSGDMTIRSADELPSMLPTTAEYPATTGGTAFMNGCIVGTGTSKTLTYFRWDSLKGRWIEDAAYGAATGLLSMPLRVRWDSIGWTFGDPVYQPRPSGDAESNPDFNFLKHGITGMTTFQGRLVLLSNEYACMSASNDPLRWYKRSATSIADDDPVEVAAQGTLTAPYVHGITYNKDLVLFSSRYQAVIPGGGVITPRTATLSLTTSYEVETLAQPVAAGRSLYFSVPRSLGFAGIQEMLPSPSTDSHYVADDITSHIPSYIIGPTAFISPASTSGFMVMGADNGSRDILTVYQYIWGDAQKVQQAWHRWEMRSYVLGAYLTGDTMMLVMYYDTHVFLARLDLRALTGAAGLPAPRYDMQYKVTCSAAGELPVPSEYFGVIAHDPRCYRVTAGEGQYLERRNLDVIRIEGGTYFLGVPEATVGVEYIVGNGFTSLAHPSPPVVRDHNEVAITTSRATLRQYRVSYRYTGEFEYRVGDGVRTGDWIDTTPLRLYSRNLGAGLPFVDTAVVVLPARVDMLTSTLELRADGPYDLNIGSLEYGYKHNLRYRRT
jgi:hypothetical protein